MKHVMMVLVLLAALCTGQGEASAQTYMLQVANQHMSGTNFIFDIYLVRTAATDIYLGNCDFVLTFTSENFTSPVATVLSMDAALSNWYTVDPTIVSGNRIIVNVQPGFPSTPAKMLVVSQSGTGSLIAEVSISGVSNPSGTAGLAWRDATPNATSLSSITPVSPFLSTDITNAAFHVSPDNLVLPITLASFKGSVNAGSGGVVLEWKTASEVDNYGYTVQRKGGSEKDFGDLPNAFIAGKGTTLDPQSYSFVDNSITGAGSYSYRLKQQDLSGAVHYTQSVLVVVSLTDVVEAAPRVFLLTQNYPNPFNPSTRVKFSVESTEHAVVKVYNTLGAEVATLFDGTAEAGHYYVATFDASKCASGIYFYRLTTEKKTDVKRMMLVK
jgi:hypothetical protein